MISLYSSEKGAILKACITDNTPDELIESSRDRLLQIRNKKPLYDKSGKFTAWEFPGHQIGDVLELFKEEELECNNFASKLINLYKLANIPLWDLPLYNGEIAKSLDGKIPKEHQEKLIRCNFDKKAILIAFYQGLGKTITSCLRRETINSNGKTLIVCPKVLVDKWQSDIFDILGRDAFIYYDKSLKKKKELIKQVPEKEIVVTTYECVKDIPYDIEYEFIIIDEAHIPGGGSKLYKDLYKLLRANEGAHMWALTGTPMRLNVESLYDVCRLIDPVWAGRKSNFVASFQKEDTVIRKTKVDRWGNKFTYTIPIKVSNQNIEELQERLSTIMYRVTWEGKMDFEDKIEIIPVSMTKKQKEYYEKTRDDLKELFATTGTRFPMLEGLRLLQVCDGSYTLFEDTCESGKMDFVLSDLKNRKDQKACIWFRYLPGVSIIKEKLGDKCVTVTGDTKPELKKYAKWAFNGVKNEKDKEEFYRIKDKYELTLDLQEAQYYSSTYSLRNGMGLDLDESSLNYFMSYDYSPASLSQARARIVRLSQTDDCESLFLVCRETLEPQSLSSIIRKMERQHELLDGIQSSEYDLNRELREILMKEINR